MGFRETLRQHFDSLTPAQQQAAKYVLDHPNEVATNSMRALSASMAMPPASLVRLAQHLGFDGWPALKAALQQDLGLDVEPYAQKARGLVGRVSDQGLVAEMFKVHQSNLEVTEAQNTAGLQRAAALLENARVVHVAGFRACLPVAYSLMYVYRLFRDSVTLLDGMGGALEMQVRALQKDDAVTIVSFSPYSREALAVAQQARETGCKVLALTDTPSSPLALMADEALFFSTRSPSFFPSIAAAQALSEALLELLVSRAGKAGIARIEQAERRLFESGAYQSS